MFRKIIAMFHLNLRIVCEESAKIPGPYDYHDYCDDAKGQPWHMVLLKCKRCGKEFYI